MPERSLCHFAHLAQALSLKSHISYSEDFVNKENLRFQVGGNGNFVVTATNPAGPDSWQPLNVPENAPVYSAESEQVHVPDIHTNAPAKFYRLRVFEP